MEYVVDRVDTTSTVFMGLTVGCARCHNHKYDPITQREYYQLFAYFNNIPEYGRVNNFGNAPPWIFAPDRSQQRSLRVLDYEIRTNKRQLTAMLDRSRPFQMRWERTLSSTASTTSTGAHWFPDDDLVVRLALDENAALEVKQSRSGNSAASVAGGGINGPQNSRPVAAPNAPRSTQQNSTEATDGPGFKDGTPTFLKSPLGQGVKFDGRIYFDAGQAANFDYRDRLQDFKDRFSISVWIYPDAESSGAIVTRMRQR